MAAGLFSAREALARAAPLLPRRPLLIVCDFDGTISRITREPEAAAVLPLARRALRALATLLGVQVAILSGRSALDVAGRVRVGGIRYLGNHGLESGHLGRGVRPERLVVLAHPSSVGAEAAPERIVEAVRERVRGGWLFVERKGPAVAFHYRQAPDEAAAHAELAAALDDAGAAGLIGGYELLPGRKVLELRPRGAIAKGEAIGGLIAEMRPAATLVIGDDRSDASAFALLRQARADGRTRGLAVGVGSAESPPELRAAADLLLASPEEAARFLSALARTLHAREASGPGRYAGSSGSTRRTSSRS